MVRVGVCVSLVLALAACDDVAQVADMMAADVMGVSAPHPVPTGGLRTLEVFRGNVTVSGPDGYCIDPTASRPRRGFAVLAGCAVLSDDVDVLPALNGLITVQVGPRNSASVLGNEDAFAAFLQTDQGRQILSQNGDDAAVADVVARATDNAVLAYFDDTTGPSFPETGGPQWRGFADVQDRLVTVTVRSFDHTMLNRADGERLLITALEALSEMNEPGSLDGA